MTELSVDDAGLSLADPNTYTDDEGLHRALSLLRRNSPIHRVEAAEYEPFWAVTRHADVIEIERDHESFLNAPRTTLNPVSFERHLRENGGHYRTLPQMDGHEHRALRAISAEWFRPGVMRGLEARIRELAKRSVDRMLELGGTCEFVNDVARQFPAFVILELLGMPEADFPFMQRLAQQVFGKYDKDKAEDVSPEGFVATRDHLYAYFRELTDQRRTNPTADLASAIANARVDGEHLSERDTLSYYVLIATAGHDTTGATLAGGLHALIENPGQLARIKDDPSLISKAADEMFRWVTPVKSFMRTATEDREVRGVRIPAGDSVLLLYPSANRDEEIFDDPFRFDVGRAPNKHLSFGLGVHYCLGAALAKMEVCAFYEELLPRLRFAELAGEPALTATMLVGGIKRLPLRYSLEQR